MNRLLHLLVPSTLLLAACGGGSGGGAGAGGGVGGTGGGGGSGGGAVSCSGEFSTEHRGTCVVPPTSPATRSACGDSTGISEYCDAAGTATPRLDCLTEDGYPAPIPMPQSRSATMAGTVKVFSAGGNSDGVKVEVFRASDITSAESLGQATPVGSMTTALTQADIDAVPPRVRACPTKDVLDHPPCSKPTTDCNPACNSALSASGAGAQYCSNGMCLDRQRYEAHYEIPNVPVDTALIVRTGGPMGAADTQWAPLVAFRVVLSSTDPVCASETQLDCWEDADKTRYRYLPNALSRNDYKVIPTSAGLSSGIPAGKGAVAGEVRDCDNVRVEFAQIGVAPAATTFTYFNDNFFNTRPNLGRLSMGTDGLGLFSAFNVAPGSAKVAAVGLVGGLVKTLGVAEVFVFPDTVTTVNINGGRPIR